MRKLLLMHTGAHALALFADETDGSIAFTRATPLPFAPQAVVGIISARGRMRTVIDPRPLISDASIESAEQTTAAATDEQPRQAVLIKGDEQLALAVAHVGKTIEIDMGEIQPADSMPDFARGTFRHEGSQILILDSSKLFDAATRGMERRRRRR